MTFVNGLFFRWPGKNAPKFIIGSLSAKREELIEFLNSQKGEWVNMTIKESKENKLYIALDEWEPKK